VRAFFYFLRQSMAFEHVATGTGTDQELLELNRAMQARIMANGQE